MCACGPVRPSQLPSSTSCSMPAGSATPKMGSTSSCAGQGLPTASTTSSSTPSETAEPEREPTMTRTSRWRVDGVRLDIDASEDDDLAAAIARRIKVSPQAIHAIDVVKRSFDARGRPRFVYTADVSLDPAARMKNPGAAKPAPEPLAVPESR